MSELDITEMLTLRGRTALVLGGGRGIGNGIAKGLAKAGAAVIIASRNLQTCEHAVEELKEAYGVQKRCL
jgi:NAD(P)-dependent dehydrogenase (short-subunit alcohol dehydrogenase family)